MKKTVIAAIFALAIAFSASAQAAASTAPKATVKPTPPAAEYAAYKPGTAEKLQAIYDLYTQNKLADAEKAGLALIDFEPNCLEVRWILSMIYKQKGEIGNMVNMFADAGIREAKESDYERLVVYQGSKGYVLQVNANSLRVDYNDSEVKVGDSLVVYAEGAVLQHPITLQILYVEKRLVAEIEIKSSSDSHSIAEIVKQYGDIAAGMRVIPKADYNDLIDTTSSATSSGAAAGSNGSTK